jgi:hypothetical protein
MEVDAALTGATYDVSLPTDGLPARDQVSAVYACPGGATLVEFRDGLTVVVDGSPGGDRVAGWQRLADARPEIYSVGEVHGVSAGFIDPAGDASGDTNGGVEFVLGGVRIAVGGNGKIPLSDLVDAAASIEVSPR